MFTTLASHSTRHGEGLATVARLASAACGRPGALPLYGCVRYLEPAAALPPFLGLPVEVPVGLPVGPPARRPVAVPLVGWAGASSALARASSTCASANVIVAVVSACTGVTTVDLKGEGWAVSGDSSSPPTPADMYSRATGRKMRCETDGCTPFDAMHI